MFQLKLEAIQDGSFSSNGLDFSKPRFVVSCHNGLDVSSAFENRKYKRSKLFLRIYIHVFYKRRGKGMNKSGKQGGVVNATMWLISKHSQIKLPLKDEPINKKNV